MSEGSIVTGIDNLLQYLREHGETESVTLAASLNVSEKTIEDWANVLEKAKMVRISYKLGKMYASPIVVSESSAGETKRLTEIKKSVVEREIESQITSTNELSARLDEYSKFVTSADTLFKTKAGALKDAVDRVYKLQDEITGRYNAMKEGKAAAEKLALETEERLKGLQAQEEAIKNFNLSTGNARAVIDDIRSKIYATDESISGLIERFDKEAESERKRLSDMAESIRAESRNLAEIASGEEKQLKEYEGMAEQHRRAALRTKKSIDKERQGILDNVTKARAEADRMYDSVEKEVKRLNETLDRYKKSFGGFATLSDRLSEVKKGIAEIGREKESVSRDLDEMLKQLREAEGLDASKVNEKKKAVDSVEKRTKVTAKRLVKASGKKREVKEHIDTIAK